MLNTGEWWVWRGFGWGSFFENDEVWVKFWRMLEFCILEGVVEVKDIGEELRGCRGV